MKKILTNEDRNTRPQIGYELIAYARQALLKTNTANLSRNWNTTDMVRYFMAKGIEAETGKPLPASIKGMFKRFDKDLDL